jgi:acyl-CoA synthetase (AMP-forming)/AMP-acid ligase II
MQVSPLEIEDILLAHPKNLVIDAAVAGVSVGRMPDEKVPRAWVVLSDSGKMLGRDATIRELEAWHHEHLSKHKWLRGGIEVVYEVGFRVAFDLIWVV